MASKLKSPVSRRRLRKGREPHWQELTHQPRTHLGYQRGKDAPCGRWLFRRLAGTGKSGVHVLYNIVALGLADDDPGSAGMSYAEAEKAARALADSGATGVGAAKKEPLTVRAAVELYEGFLRSRGSKPDGRLHVHVLPFLGETLVADLTRERLRKWLADLANAPAQVRPKRSGATGGAKPQFRAPPTGEEATRKRHASANRVLMILKAALNHAADEGHVKDRDAWGRALKPFRGVDQPRLRWLTMEEVRRLLNACGASDFGAIARGALESGCRYSELARLRVADFDPEAGTLFIAKSKSRRSRHVLLTDAGARFFRSQTVGRHGEELMFTHGRVGWKKSDATLPMNAAITNARITPRATFHTFRHTWASHAVMNGMQLMVVAKNLGHRDTRMVERHYGHLAPSFEREQVRERAPDFGLADGEGNVRALR